MKISAKFPNNFNRAAKRLDAVATRILTETDRTFLHPMRPIITEIKKRVKGDKNFNHMWHKDLFRNTRAELVTQVYTGGVLTYTFDFGYFVGHGKNLEIGSPPHDPGKDWMIMWASTKLRQRGMYTREEARKMGVAVWKKIRRYGSTAYPIIQPVWHTNSFFYAQEVFYKFKKLFR